LQGTFVFFCKFKEHGGVGDFGFELFLSFDYAFDPAALLQEFLGGLLIGPEVRRGSLRLDTI